MVAVLKTAPRVFRGVGSNPTPSATWEIAWAQRGDNFNLAQKMGRGAEDS